MFNNTLEPARSAELREKMLRPGYQSEYILICK